MTLVVEELVNPPETQFTNPTQRFRRKGVIIALLVLLLAGAGFYYLGVGVRQKPVPRREYGEISTLVPQKISQGAPIAVTLPLGISVHPEEAKSRISFEPDIKGRWEGMGDRELVFYPTRQLELGQYYTIAVQTQSGVLRQDFLIDESPKVVAIFPKENSEAPEKSTVTILFNRPMVPLTILDQLGVENIPVEITPETPGKFKWITTRNLQFIPEKRLFRSTSYSIKVKSGLVSMDGLSVPPYTATFATRPIRYEKPNVPHDALTLHHEPVRIMFNQPVDLQKTKSFIKVFKGQEAAGFLVEYGRRKVYNDEIQKEEEFIDKSVLEVYGERDRHKRSKFWDLDSSYRLEISGAIPLEGDISLKERRGVVFQVPQAVGGLSSESPRSRYVDKDFFDPEGKLWVNFYEDIDVERLDIKAKNLKEVGYGEKCRLDEEGNVIRYGSNPECEKMPDKKKVYLKFDPGGWNRSEEVLIQFRSIVNTSGIRLNAEPIVKTIKTYPALTIRTTLPAHRTSGGKLTELKLCSSTPLKPPSEEDFGRTVASNLSVGKWNWYEPFRVQSESRNTPCVVGEFENTLRYGLIPESDYSMTLSVKDYFGQSAEKTIEFRSEAVPDVYRKFGHLQKRYNVTSPERTKLTYTVENLEYVNLHLCEVGADAMFLYLTSGINDSTPGGNLSCIKNISKTIQLPKRYWTINYFQVDLKEYFPNRFGHYILSFTHPDYRATTYDYRTNSYVRGGQISERTFLTVTNLAVQEKRVERSSNENFPGISDAILTRSGGNLYWVTEFGTLNPVSDAKVELYKYEGLDADYFRQGRSINKLSSANFTGSDGIARVPVRSGLAGAVVSKGGDSTLVSADFDKFQWASYRGSAERTYLYTDRPIYRPGDQVFIKGIHRIGYDQDYEIYRAKKAAVEVFSGKGESIFKKELEISDYGTFTTDLRLDAKAPLGTYRIEALGGFSYFDVEEYAPASFKLELTTDKEEYIAGDTFSVGVGANYYFGVPVEGGEVEYSILAQDYNFDRYQDKYFRFGGDWYYSYDGFYGDSFILRGKTTLDEKGRAQIRQALDFNKFFKEEKRDQSKIFIVRVTVKNSTGQSVSGEKSFIAHRGEFYLGVNLENRYFAKGEKTSLLLKSVNTQGKVIPLSNIEVTINKIKWESFKRREVDGRFYYHSEKKKELVRSFKARTDSEGNFKEDLSVDNEGEFEIVARATDGRGNPVQSVMDFYVYGPGAVTIKPTNNETLDLAVDKAKVSAGEDVNIVIKSPYKRAKALVSVERGRIFDYSVIEVDGNLKNYTLKIKESYIPNVFVSVLLLSPRPEVKYGQVELKVNTREKELDIAVKSNKNHYLPGEEVRLSIETKDSLGRGLPSEVSIAVVDLSVLALKGNPKKQPVSFFYAGLPLAVTTASNIKNILYEAEIPTGTKGGGGLETEELAKKKRGIFRDTAYWRGVVRTGSDGKAGVSFTLPDNLTTWQAEILGITKDTKMGVGYQEFVARKDVMLTPLIPRFIIPGDEFTLGAKVFNQTDTVQKLQVSLTSSTLLFRSKDAQDLTVKPRDIQVVYFEVQAPQNMDDGAHAILMSAKNKDFEDTVEKSLPIKKNETYESVATASYTADPRVVEYAFIPDSVLKDKGGVTINTSATLAVFLSDALNYLVSYPYGCSEQIASKLSSIAIVKKGLKIKNLGDKFTLKDVGFEGRSYSVDDVVEVGLSRIYSNQTPSGGFAYYQWLEPSFHLTLQVVNTLEDLKEAGYAVDQQVLERASRYLYSEIAIKPALVKDKDLVILTGYTLSKVDGFRQQNDWFRGKILEILQERKFIREDASNLTLSYLAMLLTKEYPASFKEEVFKVLENRIKIDSRGAFLGERSGKRMIWEYYETPVKDTALLLKALVKDERKSEIMDKILRWILRSRAKDGAWGSTNNTVSVIDALTDYLLWKKETESEFDLALSVDGKTKGKFEFNKDNIFNTYTTSLPLADFKINSISILEFLKDNKNQLANPFYYDMLLKYFLPIEKVAPRDEGFSISREFYRLDDKQNSTPLTETKVGEVVKGHLTITVSKQRNFVSIEDFIPAGMELVNLRLVTEDQSLGKSKIRGQDRFYDDYFKGELFENYRGGERSVEDKSVQVTNAVGKSDFQPLSNIWKSDFLVLLGYLNSSLAAISFRNLGSGLQELEDDYYSKDIKRSIEFQPDAEELHDDRLFLFKERVGPAVYGYDYFVRALIPGKFHHLPAVVSEMYFPENFGRTRGEYFVIK